MKERYQWIKGENLGAVEHAKAKQPKSPKFLIFESGNKCSREVLDEFMVQIFHDQDILNLDLAQNDGEVKAAIEKSKQYKRNEMTAGLSYDDEDKPSNIVTPSVDSPLIPILEKSKKEKIKLNARINLELPNKKFLAVMQDSFDEDILDVLSNYTLSKIKDPSKFLQNLIKSSLNDWYSN